MLDDLVSNLNVSIVLNFGQALWVSEVSQQPSGSCGGVGDSPDYVDVFVEKGRGY